MEEAGIVLKREPAAIISKIPELVKSYCDAYQHKHQTSVGVVDN
jgi:hypothetical protein